MTWIFNKLYSIAAQCSKFLIFVTFILNLPVTSKADAMNSKACILYLIENCNPNSGLKPVFGNVSETKYMASANESFYIAIDSNIDKVTLKSGIQNGYEPDVSLPYAPEIRSSENCRNLNRMGNSNALGFELIKGLDPTFRKDLKRQNVTHIVYPLTLSNGEFELGVYQFNSGEDSGNLKLNSHVKNAVNGFTQLSTDIVNCENGVLSVKNQSFYSAKNSLAKAADLKSFGEFSKSTTELQLSKVYPDKILPKNTNDLKKTQLNGQTRNVGQRQNNSAK